ELARVLSASRDIASARGVIPAMAFGHVGNGHPHQNYLAHDAGELAMIEDVVTETLVRVVAAGGTIAAEHGIGKLKRRWLPLQLSPMQVGVMRAIKQE